MAGKFELKAAKSGKFRFNLKAANNLVIFTSEAYNTKRAALNGIESVRKNAVKESNYDVRKAKNGKPYFVLLAVNKKVIGRSQMYSRNSSMRKGIASVKTNAPKAKVVEV